jgi:hypothetical protein
VQPPSSGTRSRSPYAAPAGPAGIPVDEPPFAPLPQLPAPPPPDDTVPPLPPLEPAPPTQAPLVWAPGPRVRKSADTSIVPPMLTVP